MDSPSPAQFFGTLAGGKRTAPSSSLCLCAQSLCPWQKGDLKPTVQWLGLTL